ncbi:MAG: c-type cytochrome [Bacteroidota bacterium]
MNKTLKNIGLALFLTLPHVTIAVTDAEILSLNCNACHGPNGVSAGSSIPSIAGLNPRYFMRTMTNFKKGERFSTIMERIALGYNASDLLKMSKYFSALEWANTLAKLDGEKVRRGNKIHDELCEECHSENGQFQDHEVPRISGQAVNYLYMQMIDYSSKNDFMPQPGKMKEQLETLTDEDLKALSHFYASGS